VTSGAAAGRYARALFDVVHKEQAADLEAVQSQVDDLSALFTGNPALANAMGNPAVPVTKKVAVARAILDKAGTLASPMAKLVLMLAERDRLMLLPDIARIYRERLQQATGRRVLLESRVDPAIIGGMVTRLGSTVYDGSVTTQLQKMKQTLIGAGQ